MEAERRKNISSLLDGAKSVLSVGFTYNTSQSINKNKTFKVGKVVKEKITIK